MSWNVNVGPVHAADFPAALDAAHPPDDQMLSFNSPNEVETQLAAARQMARIAASPGVLYPDGADVYLQATLSGHANRDHEPRPGVASDMVYVSVYRVAAPVPRVPPVPGPGPHPMPRADG